MATKLAFPERDRHVRRNGKDYFVAFMKLLPLGIAWPRKPGSVLARVSRGLTNVWGYVDNRAADLLERESDPRKTTALTYEFPPDSGIMVQDGLLAEWERAWGLPDPCFPKTTTIAERQRMLVLYMTWTTYAKVDGRTVDWRWSSQSRAYFKWLMEFVGYQIEEIGEYAPFMCGISRVGDTREVEIIRDTNGVPILTPDGSIQSVPKGNYRWYIGPPEQRFAWTASIGAAQLMWFRAASGQAGVDHHLEIGVPDDLNCLLNRWKPAHTDLVLDFHQLRYGSPMAGTP